MEFQSEMARKAFLIAQEAHKGQKDKGGQDYICHPLYVASHVGEDEICMTVALLHDVAEDTDVTLEELAQEFPPAVMDALKLLTHDKSVPYMEYIRRVKTNPVAAKVKLADLEHNMDLSRLREPGEKDYLRLAKYKQAREILLNQS